MPTPRILRHLAVSLLFVIITSGCAPTHQQIISSTPPTLPPLVYTGGELVDIGNRCFIRGGFINTGALPIILDQDIYYNYSIQTPTGSRSTLGHPVTKLWPRELVVLPPTVSHRNQYLISDKHSFPADVGSLKDWANNSGQVELTFFIRYCYQNPLIEASWHKAQVVWISPGPLQRDSLPPADSTTIPYEDLLIGNPYNLNLLDLTSHPTTIPATTQPASSVLPPKPTVNPPDLTPSLSR